MEKAFCSITCMLILFIKWIKKDNTGTKNNYVIIALFSNASKFNSTQYNTIYSIYPTLNTGVYGPVWVLLLWWPGIRDKHVSSERANNDYMSLKLNCKWAVIYCVSATCWFFFLRSELIIVPRNTPHSQKPWISYIFFL